MKQTIIKGIGKFVPDRVVSNESISLLVGSSPEWIKKRTGIEQRYWVPENGSMGASDLGFEASKIAIKNSGWNKLDVDLVIFATLSPDVFFPGSGCFLQKKLGLNNIPTIDIRQQCTGFLYGISIADAYIKSNIAKKILLVCSEVQSTGLDITERGKDVAVIFGDGAAALCLEGKESNEEIGLLASVLHTDGSFAESLITRAPSSKNSPRLTKKMIEDGIHFPYMDGRTIFKTALQKLPEVANEVLLKANISYEQIDMYIPHQANLRINEAFAKSMNISDNKIYNNINKYGNTTAASIPIALDEAIEQKVIKDYNYVMFIGLGAGIMWGAAIYKFGKI